ncbi:microtubule-actin cross-linking factor 1 isoform X22 [Silurus meridionalis]|nr:microtubule-actin cross-linking factor 1 isoform X22 [Silurus meridionalis]
MVGGFKGGGGGTGWREADIEAEEEPHGDMSSSDEESLSERSCVSERSFRSERSGGSLSPCPHSTTGPKGDTLPWNLSKHERRKRKSQDSVLDPAERAVVRVAGRKSICLGICY